jgi:hypothetical protein
MPTTNNNIRRAIVSLKLPEKPSKLVAVTEGILKGMTGNPAFPAPVPPLAAIATANAELQTAQVATLTRTLGNVAVRDVKQAALTKLVVQLKAYIQAQADADPDNAVSIIESAGVGLRKTRVLPVRVFAVTPGPLSGTVKLIAPRAGKRASYEWECCTDAGKTWATLPPTLQAGTAVAGLVPGAIVQFRYRAVTKTGASDWSAPVSMIVH